jgi:hypothetical protein
MRQAKKYTKINKLVPGTISNVDVCRISATSIPIPKIDSWSKYKNNLFTLMFKHIFGPEIYVLLRCD